MIDFIASGGVLLGGCSSFEIVKQFVVKFGTGSIAYIKHKADAGILEAVVIKKINRVGKPQGDFIINYVDTFNAVWLEGELLYQSEAVAASIVYWNGILAGAKTDLQITCGIIVD